jgi:DNA-binding transcriptional MerR regulator
MSEPEDDLGPEVPDKLFFRIGEVAELVGVETHVLRYWEGEFKLRPTRSPSGQRMYRRKDIGKFLRIRRLLHDEGFTIAGARKALTEGGAVVAPGAPSPVEEDRLQDALDRLQAARTRIAALRQRFANERGVPPS